MSSVIYYYILAFGGIILVGIIGKRAGWFQMVSTTNKLLKDQNTELRNANELLKEQISQLKEQHDLETKEWTEKYHDATLQIAELRGKISTTIDIPLVKIDKSLRILAKVGRDNTITNKTNSEINQKILDRLEKTAIIAAKDRPKLTHPS